MKRKDEEIASLNQEISESKSILSLLQEKIIAENSSSLNEVDSDASLETAQGKITPSTPTDSETIDGSLRIPIYAFSLPILLFILFKFF